MVKNGHTSISQLRGHYRKVVDNATKEEIEKHLSAGQLKPKSVTDEPDDKVKSEKQSSGPPKGDLCRMVMAGALTKMSIDDDVTDEEIDTDPSHSVEAHDFDDVCSKGLGLSKRNEFLISKLGRLPK
jgi:hypothetical protein